MVLPDYQVQRRTTSGRTVSTTEVRLAAEPQPKDRRETLIQVLENASRTTLHLYISYTQVIFIIIVIIIVVVVVVFIIEKIINIKFQGSK